MKRYEEDKHLFNYYIKEERDTLQLVVIKDGSLKVNYSKPYERSQKVLGIEREDRTFDQPPDVSASDEAVETYNLSVKTDCSDNSQALNATLISVVGNTSSNSGTNPKSFDEDEFFGKGLGKFYTIRDYFVILSSSNLKLLRSAKHNSCRQFNSDCKCEAQTIYHSPAVSGSVGAAGTKQLVIKNQLCRQSTVAECIPCSENGKICLSSEANPKRVADLFSISSCLEVSESSFNASQFQDPDVWFQNNPNRFAHASTKDCKVKEFIFKHGKCSYYVGMRSSSSDMRSQFDYLVICLKKQELHWHRGRLIYSKGSCFGVECSYSFQVGEKFSRHTAAAKPPVIISNPSFTI
jgi:hypothetical protein